MTGAPDRDGNGHRGFQQRGGAGGAVILKLLDGIEASGRRSRSRRGVSMGGEAADGADHRERDRYIVECPACAGTGRVVRPDSQVPVGCRLCWERGRVARIAAARFLETRSRRRKEVRGSEADGDRRAHV